MRYTISVGENTFGPMDVFELTSPQTDRLTGVFGAGEMVMEAFMAASIKFAGTGRKPDRWCFTASESGLPAFTVFAVDESQPEGIAVGG